MNFPKELRYTKTHEWARRDGKRVTVGITDYAQKEISDAVFVELPKLGISEVQSKPIAVVESVKAAFDIYAPVTGKVLKINMDLETNPALINQDCYGSGWLFELEMSRDTEWDSLLKPDEYEQAIKQETK